MTVAQLLQNTSASEIGEWQAYLTGEAKGWPETKKKTSALNLMRAMFAHKVQNKEA